MTSRIDSSPPRRIVWWLPEFPPNSGGIATFADTVGRRLVDDGEDLTMLVGWGGPSDDDVDGLRVIREPFRAALESRTPARIVRMKHRIAELKSSLYGDVYHVHLCEPSPLLHLSTRDAAPTARTVVTLHNEMLDRYESTDPTSLLYRLGAASSVLINCSVGAHRVNSAAAPHWAHRMIPLPNGIDPGPPPAPLPNTPTILAVGRLVPQKGFDRLLRAMPSVLAEIPDARLRIVGDGPDRSALGDLATTLGVASAVDIAGHVERDRMTDELAAARVVVAPSRHEGLPYALLEAAAAGRPIVASDIGGIDEVVVHGLTGRLVDESALDDDPSELSAAVIDVLRTEGAAERLGLAGRHHVESQLSLEVCAERHRQMYDAVMRGPADVAIVVPAWNAERHIGETLDSILLDVEATTDVTTRVLVVDDGSTDRTASIVRDYSDRGVELFSQPNLGCGPARNTGLALTDSEFVAHFDSDDIWPAGKLAALFRAFRDADTRTDDPSPTIDVVFGTGVEFLDADAPPNSRVNTEPTPVRMLSVGLLRRRCHDRLGAIDFTSDNDQLGWVTMALQRDLSYVQVDTLGARRRIHATNKSHDRVFTDDRSRVAVIKRALDERRSRAPRA